MTALAGGARYPSVKFPNVGSSVKGLVIDFADVPVTDFGTNKQKYWPDGNPMMQTRVTLETEPGNMDSRVSLYIKPGLPIKAARKAISEAGAKDIEAFATLGMTRIADQPPKKPGQQGAHDFDATYEPPFDPTA